MIVGREAQRELLIPVHAVPPPFATAIAGGRFAAVAFVGPNTLLVTGHGSPDGVALERVAADEL